MKGALVILYSHCSRKVCIQPLQHWSARTYRLFRWQRQNSHQKAGIGRFHYEDGSSRMIEAIWRRACEQDVQQNRKKMAPIYGVRLAQKRLKLTGAKSSSRLKDQLSPPESRNCCKSRCLFLISKPKSAPMKCRSQLPLFHKHSR
jgi:hypothetical protein